MKTIIIARQLGVKSEHWLIRQIQLLNKNVEKVIVLSKSNIQKIDNLKISQLDFEYKIKYKIQSKISKKDIFDYKLKALLSILKKSNAESIIIHYVDFALNFKNILKYVPQKIFVYCHGYDITWDLRDHLNPNKKHFPTSYTKEVLELSKYVTFIANSHATANKLKSIGITEDKIKVKYFGIEQNNIRPIPKEFTILYLGRLVDFKGPEYVIKAFELACSKGLIGKLIIAGDGPLRPMIELLRINSKYKNKIKILGAVNNSEAQLLFKSATIFTAHNCLGELSRQEEAFGVSIIEAMSYGLPVVTGASGGIRESVVDNHTGFLFPPHDIEKHAEYLLKYYQEPNLLKSHSQNAQDLVTKNFSIEKEHQSFKNILK